jgi:hypothetical protein
MAIFLPPLMSFNSTLPTLPTISNDALSMIFAPFPGSHSGLHPVSWTPSLGV